MRFTTIIPLLGCLCNIFFTLFVISRNFTSSVNRVYFLLGLTIANWNFSQFILLTTHSHDTALLWVRIMHFGLVLGIVFFFHLSLLISGVSATGWMRVLYVLYSLLAFSVCTGHFITDVRFLGVPGWYAIPGSLYYAFAASFVLAALSVVVLLIRRRTLPLMYKRRLDALILAQSMLTLLGLNDLLPIIGFEYYPFTQIQVYPYGTMAASFYGVLSGYAVLQHQLLDFQVTLSRFVAHGIRFAFLFFVSFSLLLLVALIFPSYFNAVSLFSDLVIIMVSGAVMAIFFPRMFGSGMDTLERRILGDRFEYQDQISSFVNTMYLYNDTTTLLDSLHGLLVNTIKVENYSIVMAEEHTNALSIFRAYPTSDDALARELIEKRPVLEFFHQKKIDFVAYNSAINESESREAGNKEHILSLMRAYSAELCFPFVIETEPIGVLLLGRKKNSEPFTSTDINLLVALSKNLGVMINQIRLKNKILHAEELELLGRMSRGMAHDLNNLLTPLWTFLQLSSEGVSARDLHDDLLPLALRNLKTMRAYIREALFFSENLRPDFQYGRLDAVLAQAAEMVKPKAEGRGVNIAVDAPVEMLAEMDEVLVQRLVANLISNSIDASPPQTTVRVELVRLLKTEAQRDWLRIRVIDSGEGIKHEDLPRVLAPYFTTKNRGDETRGFGLGLAICRKIVHLHGGHLNIFSQWKKGTTVQVDLPNRQTKPHTESPVNIS